jgi:hypothetical protein
MPVRTQHPVAATVAPLGDPASAFAWLSAAGIRGAQLSATQPGMRPRELGESARRDLRADWQAFGGGGLDGAQQQAPAFGRHIRLRQGD